GLILMPMMLGLIVVGIVAGFLITRTGRYKEFMLLGTAVVAIGLWMLTRLGVESSPWDLTAAIAVMGAGLGMAMQQYTLVVQNAVPRSSLGVATATLQFFRNVGNTVGIAIFGSVMTAGLAGAIASHLPGELTDTGELEGIDAGAALDPAVTAGLRPEVLAAIRAGLADQLHDVFLLGLPIMVVVFLATLAIRSIPLRDTVHTPDEAQREYLDTMAHSAPSENYVPGLRHEDVGARTRERVLGIQLALLSRQAGQEDRPFLTRAVAELGEGDLERGRRMLHRAALMLTSDDAKEAAEAERFAVELCR